MSCRRLLPGLCLVLIALGSASAAQEPAGQSKLVPPGWTVEPAQGSKSVIRYVSPDRTAMLTLGDEARDGRSVAEAFAAGTHRDGDRITYARKARSWFVLSGYRGGEIFYTRAGLACGGQRWHILELTYPRAAKRAMDAEVTRLSRNLSGFANVCPKQGRAG